MRVAVISANLGSYDPPYAWVDQRAPEGVSIDIHRFTDENFPARPKAMTPALQVGLLKWFGPDFVLGAQVYLWVDASMALLQADSVEWLLDRLLSYTDAIPHRSNAADMLVFAHPDRRTIREEYEFIKARLARPGETYLTKRYAGEWLDAQFAAIEADGHADDPLFATTAILYQPTSNVRACFKETWFGKTRYHLHDQLWFSYAVAKFRVPHRIITDKYTDCYPLTYVRNKKRTVAA